MIRKILAFLPHRTIMRDGERYLTRYYLLGKRRSGWRKWLPFNLYLHCFHVSDVQPAHNHPWSWSRSLILWGSYEECRTTRERGSCQCCILERRSYRTFQPGNVNRINADTWHYVTLRTPDVWTLFLAGPRVQCWGFADGRPGT